MDEILLGCFKVIAVLTFVLCAPVIIGYYAYLGVRHVLKDFAAWWAANEAYVIFGLVALVIVVVGFFILYGWWQVQQVKNQRRRALRQLDRLHQQTAARIDRAGSGGGSLVVIPKK